MANSFLKENTQQNLIINNISKIFTPFNDKVGDIKEIKNASIIIENGKIKEIITNNVEVNALTLENYTVLDAKNLAAIPGFIDSHSHPVFAATRENEFEMRNQGKSYLEIAENGGGINNSVKKLRDMNENDLFYRTVKIIKKFLQTGTTTLEAKSGYGLTLKDELKMLKVIKRINDNKYKYHIDLVPTFLGAHGIPLEYKGKKDEYINLVINQMLPAVAKENLAEACDIFIEKNYYTIEDGQKILSAAKKLGMQVKIHADQLTNNDGSKLAAELAALSADHLEFISDEAIDLMIKNKIVFNLLPGATYFVGIDTYPPARKIIEKGGIVALSTDFNPGTCYIHSLPMIMNIGSIKMQMTANELFWASTIGGAKALGRDKTIGSIEIGKNADILLVDIDNLQELPYSFGTNLVKKIVKNGIVL